MLMKRIAQPESSGDASRRRELPQGFTLLELLIAMGLLVLLVAIMMGALRLSSRSVAAGERRMETQERFRTVSALLDSQIQSQMPLTYEEEGGQRYYFRGDRQALRLATNSSIWGGVRGYVIVQYRIEAGRNGKQTLYASEESPGVEGKRETELFTNADEIFFAYYRREPNEDAGYWREEWDDDTAFPEKIKLHVDQGAGKFDFQFPVRARGNRVAVPLVPVSASGGTK